AAAPQPQRLVEAGSRFRLAARRSGLSGALRRIAGGPPVAARDAWLCLAPPHVYPDGFASRLSRWLPDGLSPDRGIDFPTGFCYSRATHVGGSQVFGAYVGPLGPQRSVLPGVRVGVTREQAAMEDTTETRATGTDETIEPEGAATAVGLMTLPAQAPATPPPT